MRLHQSLSGIAVAMLPILCVAFVTVVAISLMGVFASSDGCCGPADIKQLAISKDRLPADGNLPPELYARRIDYVGAAQFQALGIVATLGFGGAILVAQIRRGNRRRRIAFSVVMLVFAVVFAVTTIGPETSASLHNLLERTVRTEFAPIETFRITIERITSASSVLLILIASLLLLPVHGDIESRLRQLVRRQTELSYLLALGTVLLVGDILLKRCAARWAAAYFTGDAHTSVLNLVDAITSGWAVYDSLVLAAAYIPAAVVLRNRLRHYAAEVDQKTPPAWFEKEWLAATPLQEVSRLLAILAPFLVGKATDIAALLG